MDLSVKMMLNENLERPFNETEFEVKSRFVEAICGKQVSGKLYFRVRNFLMWMSATTSKMIRSAHTAVKKRATIFRLFNEAIFHPHSYYWQESLIGAYLRYIFYEKAVKMNVAVYKKAFVTNVVALFLMPCSNNRRWVFQQDAAPGHRAKTIQDWLAANKIDFSWHED